MQTLQAHARATVRTTGKYGVWPGHFGWGPTVGLMMSSSPPGGCGAALSSGCLAEQNRVCIRALPAFLLDCCFKHSLLAILSECCWYTSYVAAAPHCVHDVLPGSVLQHASDQRV
jgi:hypothetical protein